MVKQTYFTFNFLSSHPRNIFHLFQNIYCFVFYRFIVVLRIQILDITQYRYIVKSINLKKSKRSFFTLPAFSQHMLKMPAHVIMAVKYYLSNHVHFHNTISQIITPIRPLDRQTRQSGLAGRQTRACFRWIRWLWTRHVMGAC